MDCKSEKYYIVCRVKKAGRERVSVILSRELYTYIKNKSKLPLPGG